MFKSTFKFYRQRWNKVNRKDPRQVLKFFLDHKDLTISELFQITGLSDYTIHVFKKKCKIARYKTIETSDKFHIFTVRGPTQAKIPDPPVEYNKQWILDKYREGYSVKAIAKACNRSYITISMIVNKAGLTRGRVSSPYRNKQWLEEQVTKNRKSAFDISKIAGVTSRTVDRWLSRFQIVTEYYDNPKEFIKTTGKSINKASDNIPRIV